MLEAWAGSAWDLKVNLVKDCHLIQFIQIALTVVAVGLQDRLCHSYVGGEVDRLIVGNLAISPFMSIVVTDCKPSADGVETIPHIHGILWVHSLPIQYPQHGDRFESRAGLNQVG